MSCRRSLSEKAAAMQLLGTTRKSQTIVVLLNDSGLNYLSTDLWETGSGS
jgi:hypothetical protein